MAHELARRADGSAAIAFVGETPWHGLGQQLTKGASIGVWKKEAGLDWNAIKTPLQGWSQPDGPTAIDFLEHVGIYRSDTMAPLAIVGAGYKVVQPGEVLEFFRDLVETGGWHLHTAGVLRGGRKVWAMATNDQAAYVVKGDRVMNNLVLATSMDGSMRTTAIQTSVRVVCANTLAMAMKDTAAKVVAVSHRTHFDRDQALHELGIDHGDRFKLFMEAAKEMADTPIKLDEARHLLHKIFRVKEQQAAKPKTSWLAGIQPKEEELQDTRAINDVLALCAGLGKGSTLKGVKGTRWGLLNGVTEYVDHHMGRTDDTRLDSAWFGRGNTIKTDALHLIATA